jgi:Transposase DNA-binding/Transposase DDE domain
MNRANEGLWDVSMELSRARLPDKRLGARVTTVMRSLASRPADSFPEAMGSNRALEAFYRLVNNPRVNHPELLASHVLSTVERAAQVDGDVLAVHDTSTIKFPHLPVEEIGELNTKKAGFFAHPTLLLDGTAERCPLGVVALKTIHRVPGGTRHKLSGAACSKLEDRESDRWFEAVCETETQLFGKARVVHVMDREGDSYELFARLLARGSRFVIRGDDRKCLFDGERTHVKEVLSRQRVVTEREVTLAKRTETIAPKSARPVREARMAQLSVAACTLQLKASHYISAELPKKITLNVVHVFEPNPPEDTEPVEWLLFTTEPIETDAQLLRVVDIYRHRWVIEEFFKALKTGCLYEERQLESREALLNALVFFLPIACQLLWLRSYGRNNPDAPAKGLVTETQELVIRHFSSRKLSQSPTARELIWAIAAIGGHLKRNGEPGWQVLGRAWRRVLELEAGWLAARATFQKSVIT